MDDMIDWKGFFTNEINAIETFLSESNLSEVSSLFDRIKIQKENLNSTIQALQDCLNAKVNDAKEERRAFELQREIMEENRRDMESRCREFERELADVERLVMTKSALIDNLKNQEEPNYLRQGTLENEFYEQMGIRVEAGDGVTAIVLNRIVSKRPDKEFTIKFHSDGNKMKLLRCDPPINDVNFNNMVSSDWISIVIAAREYYLKNNN